MKFILAYFLTTLLFNFSFAQSDTTPLDLPDVSVIGNFLGVLPEGETNTAKVQEVEFAFQHYLYPSVRADIYTTFHNEDGEHSFELEEAYVSFSDLFDVVAPDLNLPSGIGLVTGKKLLPIGRNNVLHSESLPFVDQSLVSRQFFGEEHGLSGEGALFSYLLPLPFFSQIELGGWTAATEEDSDDHSEIHFENRIFNARLWNGYSISSTQDLDVGLSYVLGNPTADSSDDQQTVTGIDLVYEQQLSKGKSFKIHTEYYQAKYGEEGESRETQDGSFISGHYKLNGNTEFGLRYGMLGKHGDEGSDLTQISLIATRKLTDTTKFRLQYNTGEDVVDAVYFQFLFGMGPHSHVLQ